MQPWSCWKRFPDELKGRVIEAPSRPGVYEARNADTGDLIAFGHAANLATAISRLTVEGRRSGWVSMLRRDPPVQPFTPIQYRIIAATSRAQAKSTARHLAALRRTYWRRHRVGHWPDVDVS